MPRFIFAVLTMSLLSIPAYSYWPECEFDTTDQDGDGFGFENNTTCFIGENTQSSSVGICIDDDNDGWGWNGVESCRVAVATSCIDSDPIGDGWGWDGSQSCRIATASNEQNSRATNEQADELTLIRSKFGANESLYFAGWSRQGVAIQCAAQSNHTEQVFFLFEDGELKLLNGSGLWSGGWHDDDNELTLQWRRFGDPITFITRLAISNASVIVDGQRQCTWVAPG